MEDALSGIDTYTIEDVPMKPFTTSEENKLREVFTVARSERRLESRACLSNSAGLRVITTTTERMATKAKTTRSSMRVKLLLFLFRVISKELLVISYLVALYNDKISAAESARL